MERLHCSQHLEKPHVKEIDSPVGRLRLIADKEALIFLGWIHSDEKILEADAVSGACEIITAAETQLKEYFGGKRQNFDVPVKFSRGTDFQKSVWQALRNIPFGATITYGEQARRIGKPAAVRAVGAANGKNPISIIVPCHRVIGASGSLTGFGGGIEAKRFLIELERS